MQKRNVEDSRDDRGVEPPSAIRQAKVGGCAVSPLPRTRTRQRPREEGQRQMLRATFAEIETQSGN